VLIIGETGTGKELIARTVHANKGPFVVVDCTHLSADMAERELFGHVRGAFTNAHADKPGLIEAANGGTAFFDEIGELPMAVQAKLLRVLQEKTFRRLGATVESRSNFRLIAATNRDLKQAVANGTFREDLYYRLKIVRIRVPSLRRRGVTDIQLLVSHFANLYGVELSDSALDRLTEYPWPGNVRELENTIRRLSVQAENVRVQLDELGSTICHVSTLDDNSGSIHRITEDIPQPVQPMSNAALKVREHASLSDIEDMAIVDALIYTRGDRSRTAAMLKISRATLQRKLRDLKNNPKYRSSLSAII
jgi:DNA-binding NtrC family response regulator